MALLKYYNLYRINKNSKDWVLVSQFDNIDEIVNYLNINKNYLYNAINKRQSIFDKYIIIKDTCEDYEII